MHEAEKDKILYTRRRLKNFDKLNKFNSPNQHWHTGISSSLAKFCIVSIKNDIDLLNPSQENKSSSKHWLNDVFSSFPRFD